MVFTPNYTVSYHGNFYKAGQSFEIAPGDAEEMRKHGTVKDTAHEDALEKEPMEAIPLEAAPLEEEKKPVRRPGRPKKSL